MHETEFFMRKITVRQLLQQFRAFLGTRMFIMLSTKARHLSLSSVTSVRSKPSRPIPKDILPSTHVSSKWSFSLRLSFQNRACISSFPQTCHVSCLFLSSEFAVIIINEKYKSTDTHYAPFSSLVFVPPYTQTSSAYILDRPVSTPI